MTYVESEEQYILMRTERVRKSMLKFYVAFVLLDVHF
jgi:hypothetical protein